MDIQHEVDPDASAYAALASAVDDARWAFGTGFTDPLAGVDDSLPAGIEPAELAGLCLAVGDDALVLSHRLQQWVTRLPELEVEAAVANLALDLLGQARLLLARAGQALGQGDEDSLAMLREAAGFRSAAVVEAPIADFAELLLRIWVVSMWRGRLFAAVREAGDPVLTAVAAQALRETSYAVEWSWAWLQRLAGGTAESRRRLVDAADALSPLTTCLTAPVPLVDAGGIAAETLRTVVQGLDLIGIDLQLPGGAGAASDRSVHGDDLDEVLAELQQVARQHPGARW